MFNNSTHIVLSLRRFFLLLCLGVLCNVYVSAQIFVADDTKIFIAENTNIVVKDKGNKDKAKLFVKEGTVLKNLNLQHIEIVNILKEENVVKSQKIAKNAKSSHLNKIAKQKEHIKEEKIEPKSTKSNENWRVKNAVQSSNSNNSYFKTLQQNSNLSLPAENYQVKIKAIQSTIAFDFCPVKQTKLNTINSFSNPRSELFLFQIIARPPPTV